VGRDQRAFGASEAMYGGNVGGPIKSMLKPPMAMMAQPSVRAKAMADKDQSQVWAEVRKQQAAMETGGSNGRRSASGKRDCENILVRQVMRTRKSSGVDAGGQADRANYQSLIRQLRDRNAVGVVVAVNGAYFGPMVFASTDLLEKILA